MARPRVFVSSTYYDLKHVRASLDIFIDSLGFDSVLSEKGDIPYSPDVPLDQSCYREIESVDLFVLIVGGRYGSAASGENSAEERFASITKKEYLNAIENDVPVFILVEAAVYAEYRTYLRNKEVKDIKYAHVDSVQVFSFLEEILAKRGGNPVQHFERVSEITLWLREQWAGLFREYLHRRSNQRQLSALSQQVKALEEASGTLQRYLEKIVSKVSGEQEANVLIREEKERLVDLRVKATIDSIPAFRALNQRSPVSEDQIRSAMLDATTVRDLFHRLASLIPAEDVQHYILKQTDMSKTTLEKVNDLRKLFGRIPLEPETNTP